MRAARTCETVALNGRLVVVCGVAAAPPDAGGVQASWKVPPVGEPDAVTR